MTRDSKATLEVRNARATDIDALFALTARIYGEEWGHSADMLRGQQAHFPEGQFVAVHEGKVVGFCATFRISEAAAMATHTWSEITGGGFASRHDPNGDWLYGMEVCVDPEFRGLRIGRRLYAARKNICQKLGLRGIVFGGRMPGLGKRIKHYGTVDAYIDAVREGRQRDGTLSFQLRNGFELIGLLPRYVPSDSESLGYAAHLVWRNPARHDQPKTPNPKHSGGMPDRVRVATIQYQQRRITSFEEFATQIEYFVDIAANYESDFVVFPEMVTLQLLSIENARLPSVESIRRITDYTDRVRTMFSELAVRYNVNIIGGSHPTLVDGIMRNVCYVCLRDGSVHLQHKIHPTPNERTWWGIKGGSRAAAIQTDCGPIGVLICYDSEFPELARHLTDQGALILFVPFCTDERASYLRVRYCSQARAVENQCYVVLSGNVGNLPGVNNFDIQYAQSCILTPCDFPFARDGIAADSTPNTEMVLWADLRLEDLARARNEGTVQNLKDRRHDLYQQKWLVKDSE